MVCVRCRIIVEEILTRLNVPFEKVELGKVTMSSGLTPDQRHLLDVWLAHYELEVMDNAKQILVERIKISIIEVFHSKNDDLLLKFSEHLSKDLSYDYTYLANVFSEVEGSTIEKFYIQQKIQRVKELIMYEGMGLKEIAYSLNYSSVSHLCKQFKKVTGKTPAGFRKDWQAPMKEKTENEIYIR
ncbi:AraC family transcriptional regulator [Terrimonas sp. NA20]|uniref:AraC family transcriptional regulator n=1 Tax=Terrimonas ginsenosidimutans TaxID=2908004 RepID=A0ABS9KSA1_9BACT|nr:helix-turn-helix domain-containing protein [Terrimonas ginsenosidimutans]MCG2615150.1 AraC family transcriptional regulator [Terrimonas ginsenosidimutans]